MASRRVLSSLLRSSARRSPSTRAPLAFPPPPISSPRPSPTGFLLSGAVEYAVPVASLVPPSPPPTSPTAGAIGKIRGQRVLNTGSPITENKLQILRELTPFQNGFFRSGIIGNNSFCRSITTVGHPEASLGQDNTTSPDVDQPQRIKFKRLDKTAKHIMNILHKEAVEKVQAEREIPDIRPGYIVQLKVEVPENKRRISVLKGIVIARRNAGLNTTFRLRRLVAGVGVESVFPLYSPNIKEMKVLDKKKVRRAKLYYLRDRMNPLKK